MPSLGASDLDVFPLALGTNRFGWTASPATSRAILDAFVAGGGNLIDTADVLGGGARSTFSQGCLR
jgi:aryl-alcohol dehydrogenase-like predicted oxidoreductase